MADSFASTTADLLREWAPLDDLLSKLPAKVLVGLFQHDLAVTRIHAIPELLALGTNLGLVYLYHRQTGELQRLRCQTGATPPVTSVRILSTVDYMVAAGTRDGNVYIFQIPKQLPDGIPQDLQPRNPVQAEQYAVSALHKGAVCALEWSKNGMRLFSGDVHGVVALTELDFYMHLSKSVEVLNESYEIVQLNYHNQVLLVSTYYRSIVCHRDVDNKWQVSQVGKKVRKSLGTFGALFVQTSPKPSDVRIYCSRPGLRLWQADAHGNVQSTLLFKDILSVDCVEIPILNPMTKYLASLRPSKEPSFGILLPFGESVLVTYNNDILYIIQTDDLRVLGTVRNLRSVIDVSTCKDEIFILEGDHSIVRIALRPEVLNNDAAKQDIGFKSLSDELTQLNISNAEEAVESPGRDESHSLSSNHNRTSSDDWKFNRYDKISEDKDDTILFQSRRRKTSKATAAAAENSSVMSASCGSDDLNDDVITNGSSVMNVSTVSSCGGLQPDLRSLESIRSDIEVKERMLADLLNIDTVKIDISKIPELPSSLSCDSTLTLKVENVPGPPKPRSYINGVKRSEPKDIVLPANHFNVDATSSEDESELDANQRIRLISEDDETATNAFRHMPSTWELPHLNVHPIHTPVSDLDSTFNDWEVV